MLRTRIITTIGVVAAVLQGRMREHLTDDPQLGDGADHDGRSCSLPIAAPSWPARSPPWPDRHQQLMTLLAAPRTPDYREPQCTSTRRSSDGEAR